jgi:hypothetical protein
MASAHPVGFPLRETETLVGKRLVDGFASRLHPTGMRQLLQKLGLCFSLTESRSSAHRRMLYDSNVV